MIKINLEWINYMLLGLTLIFNALTVNKSLRLTPQSSEAIEIENYTLTLNSEISEIQQFSNKMIISK